MPGLGGRSALVLDYIDTAELRVLVTVESPRGRQTLAMPDDVPLEQLLPALIEVSGCEGRAERWWLRPRGERELDPERSLGQNGLYQGAVLQLLAEEPQAALAGGKRLASWSEVASYHARMAVDLAWQSSRGRAWPRLLPRAADMDAPIAGAILERGFLVAVLSQERGEGATTVTALLATLLARLRSDVVTAVDAAAAGAEANPDAFFAELRRTTDLAIVDCGVSSARASRAALAHADLQVVVSRAPTGAAPWWERNARPGRSSRQPVVAVINRTQRSRLGRAAPPSLPGADRTLSLTDEPAAAARLEAGAFSWESAPRSWQADVRALARALLAERW